MKYIKTATKAASNSEFERARIGAVVVKGGRVLSTGINKLRYTRKNDRPFPSIHAEEEAILKILKLPDGLKLLSGATIYVSRILKNGSTACAKPCKKCTQLINAVGIKRIVHT